MRRQDVGAGRGAGRRLDLEAVVDPRVVARGDDDAGRGAALDDLVRAHLGRDGADGERDRDVVGQQDLGGGRGEVLRGEPPVVGDDDALRLLAPLGDVVRDAVGAAADVLEREVVGDPRPPAVGAEDDRRRGAGSPRRVTLASSGPRSARCRASTRPRSGAAPRRTAIGCAAVMLPRSGGAMTPSRPSDAADDEVVVVDRDGLAGLDDRALAARPDRGQQGGPRPEVGPADVHRAHDDLAGRCAAPSMTA